MQNIKLYKGRFVSYILLLLIVAVIMYMLKTCSYEKRHTINTPSGGDTIDVAIEYSPISLYIYDDTLGGFNYDLIRKIALDNNLNLKFHPIVSLTDAISKLDNGLYDVLIAEFPRTSEFNDNYLFTTPVYLDQQVLVQRVDSITHNRRIKSQLDLAGDSIWVVANSPLINRVNNLSHEIGDTIYIITDSTYAAEQLTIMTAIGDVKQAVVNAKVAQKLAKEYPFLDISTNISFTQFQSWIVNKNDSLLCDSLNSWIQTIKQTEYYKSLECKYFK